VKPFLGRRAKQRKRLILTDGTRYRAAPYNYGGRAMQSAYSLIGTNGIRPSVSHANTPDEALIGAIADGNKNAMHTLFTRHNVRVYRFILRMIDNAALAEDLVSDVFLEVWRQADRFERRSKVSTWLLAIARYKTISAMRRRQHEEVDEDVLARLEDPADTADVTLEKNERSTLLGKCLTRLSPAHREIIDLVYYHDKSIAEAGEIIGIPQATVKTRMFYARKQLGEFLQQAEAGHALA
jgi:RNA polymerase sigma-70 factor (ECF subfamily)